MTAAGNAAEGIPRGNIRGGRDPLAGGTRTEMQHYTAHVTWPRRLAARVTARWDGYRVRSDDLLAVDRATAIDFVQMRHMTHFKALHDQGL